VAAAAASGQYYHFLRIIAAASTGEKVLFALFLADAQSCF